MSAGAGDAKLRRELNRLRFSPAVEAEFRADYERRAPQSRITLLLIGLLMIAVTPLYDERLLAAPREFLLIERSLDFGVEIPAILVALLLTLVPSLRRYSPAATALTTVLVCACFMAQRLLGMPHDFHVPHDLPVVTIASVLVLARLRVHFILPWTLVTLLALTAVDIHFRPGPDAYYDAISVWMLFLISVIGASLIERSARESWYRGRLLEQIALRDSLTDLPNRRHFDAELLRLISIAQREQCPLALMIFDLDRFKAYNDHYGHPAGDDCLRRIGRHLGSAMRRPLDFCARIGGEEFAAVWYGIDGTEAVRIAEALRLSIEQLGVAAAPGGRAIVSASAGLATLLPPSPADPLAQLLETLLRTADAALYEAKRAGRATLISAG